MTVVVDTSAAVAILTGEAGADDLVHALAQKTPALMSAATLVEFGIVLEARYGAVGSGVVERFLRDARVEVVAFDRDHADLAVEGWRRYGKGRHRAGLNLGDCFTYALAAAHSAPVLCVGSDFAATDIEIVGSIGEGVQGSDAE